MTAQQSVGDELRKMVQSQLLGLFEERPEGRDGLDSPDDGAASARSTAASEATLETLPQAHATALAPHLPPPETPSDEDLDLQLQPDPDAGRGRPEPGAGPDAWRQR